MPSFFIPDPNFFEELSGDSTGFPCLDILFPYRPRIKILNKIKKKILPFVPILKFHVT